MHNINDRTTYTAFRKPYENFKNTYRKIRNIFGEDMNDQFKG